MERILIFGARGYLGGVFREAYPDAVCPDVDIADARAVAEIFDREKPDVVINAAGKTGRPNIDWCEEHKEETLRSNLTGPLVLLEECGKSNIYWVHLSSGCIYEGDGRKNSLSPGERDRVRGSVEGFTEDDPPNFFGSFYSRVKGWCDQILREFVDPRNGRGGILILRLRMPFDGSPNERNLLMKLRKYAKVLDVQNSITYLPDFLEAAKTLIARRRTGIFNIVNPGTISPYEIMMMYEKIVENSLSPRERVRVRGRAVERLLLKDLPSVVRAARSNCVLSTEKLRREGIVLPDVHQRVKEAVRMLVEALSVLPSPLGGVLGRGGRCDSTTTSTCTPERAGTGWHVPELFLLKFRQFGWLFYCDTEVRPPAELWAYGEDPVITLLHPTFESLRRRFACRIKGAGGRLFGGSDDEDPIGDLCHGDGLIARVVGATSKIVVAPTKKKNTTNQSEHHKSHVSHNDLSFQGSRAHAFLNPTVGTRRCTMLSGEVFVNARFLSNQRAFLRWEAVYTPSPPFHGGMGEPVFYRRATWWFGAL